ncbi:FliM/FliN family flagellar motor switch protein [Roseovarius salis]|uniref:FliM/FliN family flagellar motor switch protein n=1 Tax=Roseovarius salis TaxID=3376063 RepID=UPI0037C7374E
MSTQNSSTVIRKKALNAREDFAARAMSPSKALRLSLEMACERRLRLPVTVCAVEQRRIPLSELKAQVAPDCLILLLESREAAPGVALMDREMVQALVESQTTGHVLSHPAPERPFTDTDAAIGAPLLDALMEGYDDRMSEAGDAHGRPGLRFADRIADVRALMILLQETDYQLFAITCDIGPGARTGEFTVILPETSLAPPAPPDRPDPRRGRFDLSELAMTAPATLEAVLDRVTLPLSRVMQLAPGMTLPIDADAIARTELVAARGHVAAVTRLGQMNGFRAVRLSGATAAGQAPPAPDDTELRGDAAGQVPPRHDGPSTQDSHGPTPPEPPADPAPPQPTVPDAAPDATGHTVAADGEDDGIPALPEIPGLETRQ